MDGFSAVAFHRRRTRCGADSYNRSLPGARRAAYRAAWPADRMGDGRPGSPGALAWSPGGDDRVDTPPGAPSV
ncbi:hypothetical protein [Streptomyces sp. NPDC001975]